MSLLVPSRTGQHCLGTSLEEAWVGASVMLNMLLLTGREAVISEVFKHNGPS